RYRNGCRPRGWSVPRRRRRAPTGCAGREWWQAASSSQRPPEQAPGANDQDDGHQREHGEQREARQDQDAERENLAIDDRAPKRAPERTETADHHDDE